MEQAAVPSIVREQRMTQWIETYADDIKKTCYIYLTDRTQAEDAMQDTFLKAWRSMPAYERKGIENDRAWLMRIAINTCKDYKRSSWFRHVDKRQEIEVVTATIPSGDTTDHELAIDICRLPEKYKQVILLYYYQSMNLREVAHALGLPLSTVQRRLKKAEELLKLEWTGGGEYDR